MALGLLLASLLRSDGQLIFSDNFSSGASALWGNERGGWVANGGAYYALHPASGPLTYSGLPYILTNFMFDVDINGVADGGIWIANDVSGQNGVVLITGGNGWGNGDTTGLGSGTSLYWQVVNSQYAGIESNGVLNAFAAPAVENAHLRLAVVGNVYSAYVNGSSTPIVALTNSTFVNGYVGLYENSSQTFENVVLQSLQTNPVIIAQTTNQQISLDDNAILTVTAGGAQPLSYQWFRNNYNIVGATNSSLVMTNVQLTNQGTYTLIVSNRYGIATNQPASLNVVVQSCVTPPSGIVAWWPANGNANDIIGGNNGVLMGGATYAGGRVAQAYSLNGVNGYVQVPDSPSWAFGTTDFSIELWANFVNASGSEALVAYDHGGGLQNKWIFWLNGGILQFHINGSVGTANIGSASFTPILNEWYHLAITRHSTKYTFYINGNVASTNSATNSIPDATTFLTIGESEGGFFFDGLLDEVAIYNRALSSGEIAEIYDAGSAGKCVPASSPSILIEPQNVSALAGTSPQFGVVAIGSQPLSYQWWFNQTNLIANATNALLTLTNAVLANTGSYSVVVSNLYNGIYSSNATLAIQPFLFRTDPASLQLTDGGLQLQMTGANGFDSIVIYASTNLMDWIPIFTNPPIIAPLQFLDSAITNLPVRFYRAVEK